MPAICLCLKVHQPWRLKGHFSSFATDGIPTKKLFDIYFESNGRDREIFEQASRKCYYPSNDIILRAIKEFKGKFKIAFSITGTFIEQCERFDPGVLETFKKLVKTGCAELLGETYYHSLSSIYSSKRDEFIEQVREHEKMMKSVFGKKPQIFFNTEGLYNNQIAKTVEDLGFKGIITEGWDHILGWRSPHFLYTPPKHVSKIPVILRDYRLSDDIGYRFCARWWDQWPLTADKHAAWLSATTGDCINLIMDYETFGEHHWPESGIHNFLEHMPREILNYQNLYFSTPTEVVEKFKPVGEIDVFEFSTLSWADMERDPSAWLGNWMQYHAFNRLKFLEPYVKKTGDKNLIKIWRYMQISDYLYWMCNKGWGDGDVHCYFSHFKNPHDAFLCFMNVMSDLEKRVFEKLKTNP